MSLKSRLRQLLSVGLPLASALALGGAMLSTVRSSAGEPEVTIKPAPVALALLDEKGEKAEKKDVKLPKGTGILKGRITLKGAGLDLPPVVKKGDAGAKDASVCAAADVPDESLVVGKEGGIANVVVYLQKLPTGFKAPKPEEDTVVFDQKGCRFTPHVIKVQLGQTVTVKSSDPIAHNTHTSPIRAKEFNSAIGSNDRTGVPLVYDKAERLPVKVKCDLHSWMTAYHVVQDHPYVGITDESGNFEIVGVPAGTHTFIVWQERAGYLEKKGTTPGTSVKIEDGKPTELNLEYTADRFKGQ